jgi:hypothetical protein
MWKSSPPNTHQPNDKPINILRGEGGWEGRGGPLWTQSGGLCGPPSLDACGAGLPPPLGWPGARLFRNRAEADRQAVPAVDGNNRQRQVDQFLIRKLLAYFCIRLVRHVVNGNQGHCLCPCQGCPLTLTIERGLAPGNEFVDALFGFAARPRRFGMQIDSIRTPIHL